MAGTIDQLIGREWSVGAQYRYTSSELNSRFPQIPTFLPGSSSRDRADLQQLNLHLHFNDASGVFARAESQWYWQKNLRAQPIAKLKLSPNPAEILQKNPKRVIATYTTKSRRQFDTPPNRNNLELA